LLKKLEELDGLIDNDGKQAIAFEIHQWHDGEFIGITDRKKKDIIKSLGLLQLMLTEEMQILLNINGSSDNLAVRNALLALRNTKVFLSDNPPMKRFGGTFKEIVDLSDEDVLDLLRKFLRHGLEMILISFY
jgi:hypothetical protein